MVTVVAAKAGVKWANSMPSLSLLSVNAITFFIFISFIAFCFGGFFATVPPTIADYYGAKTYGTNFSLIAQAYGTAALLGPIIRANTSNLNSTFIVAAVISIMGALLTRLLKTPTQS